MRHDSKLMSKKLLLLAALSLLLSACSGPSASDGSSDSQEVTLHLDEPTVRVNVVLTDEGFEPSTILIPAGRNIRLVLRNHGTTEHHYRIAGMIPDEILWLLTPDVTEFELDSMTEEERDRFGVGDTTGDEDHELHHLTPSFVPFREVSRSGIRPLPNEVHGYVQLGQTDVILFYTTDVGEYVSEDVRFPDLTGRVVVFNVDA